MASTVEAIIPELLFQRLASFSAVSPALSVAWPNKQFSAPDGTYLQADFIPNTTDNLFLGDNAAARHQGLLQVTVVSPVDVGIVPPTDIGGLIAAHFAKGTILFGTGVKVKVYEKPSVGAPLTEADKVRVPVTVLWRSFN